MGGWNHESEEHPSNDREVLVFCEDRNGNGSFGIGYYAPVHGWTVKAAKGHVIAWMELPDPYR